MLRPQNRKYKEEQRDDTKVVLISSRIYKRIHKNFCEKTKDFEERIDKYTKYILVDGFIYYFKDGNHDKKIRLETHLIGIVSGFNSNKSIIEFSSKREHQDYKREKRSYYQPSRFINESLSKTHFYGLFSNRMHSDEIRSVLRIEDKAIEMFKMDIMEKSNAVYILNKACNDSQDESQIVCDDVIQYRTNNDKQTYHMVALRKFEKSKTKNSKELSQCLIDIFENRFPDTTPLGELQSHFVESDSTLRDRICH